MADFPNTLFNTRHRSSKNRTNKDNQTILYVNGEIGSGLDSAVEQSFSGVLNRKMFVSSGTNPYGEGYHRNDISVCMTTPNHVINYVNSPYIHATTMQNIVPDEYKYSYASVAQSKPSQKNNPFVSAVTRNDSSTCDKNVNKRTVKHNSNSNLNNVNVNVACIIKDLETAQEREKQELKTATQKVYTWTDYKEEKLKPTFSGQIVHSDLKQAKGQSIHIKSNSCVKADLSKSHSAGNDLEKGQSEERDISEGEGQNDQTEGHTEAPVGKKKRKRRRRRRKKNSEGGEGNDDINSGANEDVTLHFEDDEEFPDLSTATGDATKSSPNTSVISYSDILKSVSIITLDTNQGLDKRGYLVIIWDNFLLILFKIYVVTPHLNRLDETVQMRVTTYGFEGK